MTDPIPEPEWAPGAPPVTAYDLRAGPVVVVHYWAVWDLHDRDMDARLAPLRDEYAGRICFRSCDVDRPDNRPFIRGIQNIPALGCFIGGRWYKSLIGVRSPVELGAVFEGWLAAAADPVPDPPSPAGAARVVAAVRQWLRRDRDR